ncbi:enhanced intracellular survival protein Eis [Haladaptatus pallidirubidus]|uniref:GNAT family N-acetyltransferase n=1 Tax=Haladaptatus pallidirubidus TaxID=1008152 RepID=A0AAV3UC90_9EURY|nr:GNAT family N-acetyltransferase [Haladaptatus pallidirubidus]
MPEYRPIPAKRKREYDQFLHYAFRPEDGPKSDEDDDDKPNLGDRRGLFDGDDLLCVCKHHWFTTRIRDEWHEMAGLSAVASPPESRRGGLVRQMLKHSLAEYRENEAYFSALWPFSYEFYRKYGWGTVNKYTKYETTPDALALNTDPTGDFRRLDADEWELLQSAFDAHSEGYALSIDRTEEWWRHRVFEGWKKDPYVYAWVPNREKNARGYVVYTIQEEDDGDGKRLKVWEMAHADDEAYRHLLRFAQYHDSQVETVELSHEPENTTLLDMVDNPRDVNCEIETGPMFRLVDVPRALESISYPGEISENIVLRVADSLAEWNDGTFELDTDDIVLCDRTEDDPDVTLNVNTLSQLVAGYYSVEDAERFGSCSIESDDARVHLNSLFPKRDVFLREGF